MSSMPRRNRRYTREAAARAVTNEQKSKRMKTVFFIWALVTVHVVGCSSEGDILPKKERFARSDGGATPDVTDDGKPPRDPDANCVKPGTPNNERGVGGYCEQAIDCPDDVGARFCTVEFADLTPLDDDKWFCSALCASDNDCGPGVACVDGPGSKGCAPISCLPDAGE
jgi:hypothetical protein